MNEKVIAIYYVIQTSNIENTQLTLLVAPVDF